MLPFTSRTCKAVQDTARLWKEREVIGKNAAAMDESEASIRLSPENAWVYHNRGQVCELAGDRENAIADYRKALSKKNPALTPKCKAHAQARIRKLSNYS
jgi:tetratricopeptide (TPR) repeat protein